MKYKRNMILWFAKKLAYMSIKLKNKKRLTRKEIWIYEMLEEYDFYVPKKYKRS